MLEGNTDSSTGQSLNQSANARDELRSLLARTRELARRLAEEPAGTDETDSKRQERLFTAKRLTNSAARPLGNALTRVESDAASSDSEFASSSVPASGDFDLGDLLWELAKDATRLRLRAGLSVEVQEAAAALQDLSVQSTPVETPELALARLAELRAIQAELPRKIQVSPNGPYLAANIENLTNWLGERVPARPQMALCRCGASAIKPFCDGSHAGIGFVDDKDPNRVPDRRDAYVGQQVTIFDNRGICQHSGFCTDRLATVFHLGKEPFVAPSGGRMDEIIRAVRDCPSGALSYAIDGREAREQVDHGETREPAIEVSKDGPYRVTGGISLVDGQASDEERCQGVSREHYALCRCGHSQNKPFCSGMHWYVNFHDPAPKSGDEATIFEWCGGLPALTRMTRLFYEKYVPQDPLLGPLFANMSADHPERVAKWLGEVFGGPKCYSGEYGGYSRMLSQHVGKRLTEEKRARWVALILQSAQEAGLPNDAEFRSSISAYIEWGSRLAVENSQPGCRPPEHMPMPHWNWNTAAGAPGSRIAALAPGAEEQEQTMTLPIAGEPVRFEKHIKPLFRAQDQRSMKFAFDLWSFADVSRHADAILDRLRNGTMPCDGAWTNDKLNVFSQWVETGKAE